MCASCVVTIGDVWKTCTFALSLSGDVGVIWECFSVLFLIFMSRLYVYCTQYNTDLEI